MDKKTIRKEILERRDQLTKEQILTGGKIALAQILKEDAWKKNEMVYLFASFGSEVSTKDLLSACFEQKKKVAFPKVLSKTEMEFYEVTDSNDLIPRYQGILEPCFECKRIMEPGLMIVPGVAFDKQNHRIGYGGGYYDRYLSTHGSDHYFKLGLVYSFQVLPLIETEPFDEIVDKVISVFLSS